MNKFNEIANIIGTTMTSAAPDAFKVLHKKAMAVVTQKANGGNALLGAVANQAGWYWVDQESGLMIKAGENGRMYVRGHYSKGHAWTRGVSTQVPAKWLGLDALRTLCNQFIIDDRKAIGSVPLHILAVRVWSDSALRELFQKLMLEKNLCVHLNSSGEIAEYEYTQNRGFVRAEHNIKGLKGMRFPTNAEAKCVMHKVVDGVPGLVAFEDPSKLNERVTKIFANSDGLYVGKWKAIVILTQPKCDDPELQAELDNAFCTGTTYSSGMFNFLGAARLVTKSLGGKMTIASPFTFKEFGDHAVVGNLSSWKGGLNMLLNHTGVMTIEEQIEYSEAHSDMEKKDFVKMATEMAMNKLFAVGMIKTTVVQYRGADVTLEYVETEEDFYATNLYVIYGCQYKAADDDEQDAEQYEVMSTTSSYYLDIKALITSAVQMGDYDFSVPAKVKEDIDNGAITKSKPLTSFSIRELTNFFWSYCVVQDGLRYVVKYDELNALINNLVAQNGKKASKAQKAMQQLAVRGYGHLPRITMRNVVEFINDVFVVREEVMGIPCESPMLIPTRGWNRLEASLAKLSDEDFANKWKQVMNGCGNWPGLGGDGFVIEIEDYDFFVPGFKFLKSSILPIDKATYGEDNPECMFGDTMQTVFMLLFAVRRASEGNVVDWSFNAAQHLIRMNASLFEDRYNRMSVKGTYLTIAPKFWGCNKEGYSHTIATFATKTGHMSYSKDPVLFDKAVTGVVNTHNFPRDMFGELTDVQRFAMASVAFINNDLLMSQENDSDGDLCCIRFDLKLPLYTKQWEYVAKRVKHYVDGERKYQMEMKPWKFYNHDELAVGIHSNRVAKENIGLMSSGLFQHAMLLENAVVNGGMNPFWGKMLWNLYGYIVQDEAMRMIKHSGGATSTTGRSAYYESTSILSLLAGEAELMFRGCKADPDASLDDGNVIVATNGEKYQDGFLQSIKKYWGEFDPGSSRHAGALEKAISQYVTATLKFCFAHYKEPGKYSIGGQHTGRLSGNNTNGISLALDIHRRKCTNNQYKLFNVLQRGYFIHAENTRLTQGKATSVNKVIVNNDLVAPATAIDVAQAVRVLAKREIKIPSHEAMSLAFKLDSGARSGWFAQHAYIGRLNLKANQNDTCIVKWVSMVGDAVSLEDNKALSKEMKAIEAAQQALSNEPEDIIYPDLNNWGD